MYASLLPTTVLWVRSSVMMASHGKMCPGPAAATEALSITVFTYSQVDSLSRYQLLCLPCLGSSLMLFWALYMLPPICPFLSYLQARVHWWWRCPMSLSCWRSVHTVCPSTPAFHIGIDYFLWWLLHCKRHKEEGGLKGQITVSEYPGSVQVNCRLLRFLIKDDIIFSNSMVIQPVIVTSEGSGDLCRIYHFSPVF